jgi:hypothetical protein
MKIQESSHRYLDKLKHLLRSAFGLDRDAAQAVRAECLYLAKLADATSDGSLSEPLTTLINSARVEQLRALAPVLRERVTRRVNGMELPETGRSSVEGTLADRFGQSLAFYTSVSPVIDFEMLSLLKHLMIFNPDMSQYVANVVNLGNTGHNIVIEASSTRRTEQAVKRLNESASRLYKNGAGIDGLINSYLRQIAWSGALSSEDVVNFARRRVEQVVIVPVEQIRFRYLEGQYVPHQQPGMTSGLSRSPLGLIRLSDETYRYYALETVENSPYAKPPATAAIAPITGPQTDMLDNIKFIAKKFGLLGIVAIQIKRPDKESNESDSAYRSRLRSYQAQVGAAAEKLSNKGIIVTYDDQTVTHENLTADSNGGAEWFEKTEQQVFSGMSTIPAFHGRTDSSTETYADVMYNFMVGQSGNMQRLPKRRQERTYMLDLRLGGIEVNGISIGFNRAPARNPVREAEAEKVRAQTAILKARSGMISPDDAAQECGYESAYDPALMLKDPEAANALRSLSAKRKEKQVGKPSLITLRFDRASQSYRALPEMLEVAA